MLKRVLMLAVVATAISIPTIANGATAAKKPTAHKASLTVVITNLNPPGTIVASGSQTYSGSADGKIGGTFHGAVLGVNNYTGTSFTGTITTFGPKGSTKATVTGKGTVTASGTITFTGTTKVTSGTGIYKGAKGTLTFTGSSPNKDADGDNDAVAATFTATGSIKY